MRVVLFDIDGTLIHSGGAGLAALQLAFTEAFGLTEPWEISLSGRTDRGIARELFGLHGLDHTEANWVLFRDTYLKHLRAELPRKKGGVLPGVWDLLAELRRQENVAIGLLTGNVRDGADAKLRHYQLDQHFGFGGFGDQAELRDDVAREALAATCHHLDGRQVPGHQIWVVGDTPLDIQCARHIGAKVAAVATGSFSTTELAPYTPDLLLEDLTHPGLAQALVR